MPTAQDRKTTDLLLKAVWQANPTQIPIHQITLKKTNSTFNIIYNSFSVIGSERFECKPFLLEVTVNSLKLTESSKNCIPNCCF